MRAFSKSLFNVCMVLGSFSVFAKSSNWITSFQGVEWKGSDLVWENIKSKEKTPCQTLAALLSEPKLEAHRLRVLLVSRKSECKEKLVWSKKFLKHMRPLVQAQAVYLSKGSSDNELNKSLLKLKNESKDPAVVKAFKDISI